MRGKYFPLSVLRRQLVAQAARRIELLYEPELVGCPRDKIHVFRKLSAVVLSGAAAHEYFSVGIEFFAARNCLTRFAFRLVGQAQVLMI